MPRNTDQVRNFRKEVARNVCLTHDAIYNTYQLCYQLMMSNMKGDPIDFIRHVTLNGSSVTWNDFLHEVNDQYSKILLYPHLCSISVHDVG